MAPSSWAQRLRRVFAIDITRCRYCEGRLRVIVDVIDPEVIQAIFDHTSIA
jgi:hypothetical protein